MSMYLRLNVPIDWLSPASIFVYACLNKSSFIFETDRIFSMILLKRKLQAIISEDKSVKFDRRSNQAYKEYLKERKKREKIIRRFTYMFELQLFQRRRSQCLKVEKKKHVKMYACQSKCLNDADRHHQHVKEEK